MPLFLGVVLGLVFFSRMLSYLFSNFKDITIALLTGFVAGSLLIIWPWKNTITSSFGDKEKAIGYEWILPNIDTAFFLALGLMGIGFFLVWMMEKSSPTK